MQMCGFPDRCSCIWQRENRAQIIAEACDVRTAVSGETAGRAQKAVDAAKIAERMKKTGGTNIVVEHVSVELGGEPFLSAAQLNDLRRRAVGALERALAEARRPYEPVRGEAPCGKSRRHRRNDISPRRW